MKKPTTYGLSVSNLMRLAASRAGAIWVDACQIAQQIAEESVLEEAIWLDTDTGRTYNLGYRAPNRR